MMSVSVQPLSSIVKFYAVLGLGVGYCKGTRTQGGVRKIYLLPPVNFLKGTRWDVERLDLVIRGVSP